MGAVPNHWNKASIAIKQNNLFAGGGSYLQSAKKKKGKGNPMKCSTAICDKRYAYTENT